MKFFYLFALLFVFHTSWSQNRFIDRSGFVRFYSEARLENIEATSNQGLAAINLENGEIAVVVLMKSFSFKKSLMQTHFNESYVESDKYPKATFQGKFRKQDLGRIRSSSKSKFIVSGQVTIHGVTQPLEAEVILNAQDEELFVDTSFPLTVADFNIQIPNLVRENIAKTIEVYGNFRFDLTKSK